MLLGLSSIHAQEKTSAILGKVVDGYTEEPLILATVKIAELKDSIFTTDMNGNYKIESLVEGDYHMKVTYVGYKSDSMDVYLKANSRSKINFYLKPSDVVY